MWGADPIWIVASNQPALFREVRNRAYGYCVRGDAVDPRCAQEQDESVRVAVLTLMLLQDQSEMPDKSTLSDKERRVADDPQLAEDGKTYCWSIYNAHGAIDARLLSLCLGNLTDFSQLVPTPVP
jgi:hypothetical protein